MDVNMIEMKGLKKYFTLSSGLLGIKKNTVKAIDNVDFCVRKGEIMGLVGESGSGKTTLARIILNLIKPTESSVLIDGQDISKLKGKAEKNIRKKVAVVFQDPAANLNPRATVGNSIMRPLLIHGVSREEAKKRAIEAMELVKLDTSYLNSYPNRLSGGQQQRIAIARALVLKPEVMILDEPTSALDISVQAQVLNLLLDLQESLGLTYLIITHDLNVIRYVCDRVSVMYLGKMVECGNVEEVIASPKHPYTRELMKASPVINPHLREEKRKYLTGEPGELLKVGEGCRFCPRCSQAAEKCRRVSPDMRQIKDDYYVACHFVSDSI